jgi:glycosyltransferase involved in cell wall biosynthesis
MKIAYLTSEYPKVSHTFIRREILALEELGFDILRFSIRPSRQPLVDEQDIRELSHTTVVLQAGLLTLALHSLQAILRTPARFLRAGLYAARMALKGGVKAPHHAAYLVEACYLSHVLRAQQVEHVHVHFGANAAAAALLCHLLSDIPYSMTIHGPYDFDHASTLSLDVKVRHAAFVGVVSLYGRAQLMRWCGVEDWEKLHLIRCGLDQTFIQPTVQPLPAEPVLVNIARLHTNKGQLILLAAMSLLKHRGVDARLNIVGDGPVYPQLEQKIAELGLSEQVTLLGSLSGEGVREALLKATALVVPSLAENLPVVIMEAFAMGRPVVATQIAGIPELVKDGHNGLLIHPGSATELADAIQKMVSLPIDAREAMGKHGCDLVATHHNIATEAHKLARLMRDTRRDN